MRYLKGDIVEIITAQYKSYQDVPTHEIGYFENNGIPVPFIGQRYRVETVGSTGRVYKRHKKTDICLGMESDALRLYKRPLKNWIKSLLRFKK